MAERLERMFWDIMNVVSLVVLFVVFPVVAIAILIHDVLERK